MARRSITQARAQHIARSHPCVRCGEFSFKKIAVKRASEAHRLELGVAWQVVRVCGICGTQQDMGIDPGGDVVYEG